MSALSAGVTYGVSDPVGVPWAEWRFAGDFDAANEISPDKTSDPDSLMRRNPASAAISISGGKVVFTQTGPNDFLRLDIDDLAENGGGMYVNAYTMIFDVKAMNADWLPIYNTNYNNQNAGDFWIAADGSVGSGAYSNPGVVPLATWVRLAVVRRLEGSSWVRDVYVNGAKVLDNLGAEALDDNSSLYTNTQQDEGQFTILSDSDATAYAGCELDNFAFVAAALSDEEVAGLGAYRTQGIFGVAGLASQPAPADEATDVPCDSDLSWTPAETAQTHDVYFGTNFDDVNEAARADARGVLVSQDQTEAVYDPGRLEFGQTYYWRIDEVNGAPDYTVFKGETWTFTVEPYGYPITNVTATASSSQAGMGPENTVNGSGLNANDEHSVDSAQMWSSAGALPHWIQYEFDAVYKLHELWVWNSNQLVETFVGLGAKDVRIEYSNDGQTWAQLEGVPQFAKASGLPTYKANTTIDFGGVMAKFVKLTIETNWGGITSQTGLSEVRFFYVPVQAFQPDPADGADNVSIETGLSWRPGREATSHTVFLGVDEGAVANGSAPAQTVTEHSYTPESLDFATTYYWRVDEVGDAGTYAGDVWSFTTQEYAAIDDFESYNDEDRRIYDTWIDGWVNKTGSQVGYSDSPFAERSVVHGGSQAMPLQYDNTSSPFLSEADRVFDSPQDWTAHGANTLSLCFRGISEEEGNSAEGLYVTVKDSAGKSKTIAHPNAAATTLTDWQQWTIPLSEFAFAGLKMNAVKSITIGVGNKTSPTTGGLGKVFIDDIEFGAPLP
ncbi:MAG: discoidin domain-containing protein [Solirubrobacterales bacterium]